MQSLSELHEDMGNRYFKNVIKSLVDNITAGDSLNEAMAREPRTFPDIYVNVIAIGEETGLLDNVFFDLARHFKRLDDLILQTRKSDQLRINLRQLLSRSFHCSRIVPACPGIFSQGDRQSEDILSPR